MSAEKATGADLPEHPSWCDPERCQGGTHRGSHRGVALTDGSSITVWRERGAGEEVVVQRVSIPSASFEVEYQIPVPAALRLSMVLARAGAVTVPGGVLLTDSPRGC